MSASLRKRIFTGPFWKLESFLGRILGELAGGEPLLPRRVIVISHLVRDRLQSLLASTSAIAGVSFWTLDELAREHSLGMLFRNAPLPPLGGEAISEYVFRKIAQDLGPLRPPLGVEGYPKAAYETWKDLAEAGISPDDLRSCARRITFSCPTHAARLRDLARIAEAFDERFSFFGFYDKLHLLQSACEAMEAEPPRIPTVFYGFSDMNALQRRLVLASCRESRAVALVPADREALACEFAFPLISWFEVNGFIPQVLPADDSPHPVKERPLEALCGCLFTQNRLASPPNESLRIVSAPFESREAYEICRELLYSDLQDKEFLVDRKDGVILPGVGKYSSLFQEVFQSLGVPVLEEYAGCRVASRSYRLFLLMLSLKARGYPRRELIRFLDEGSFCASRVFLEEIFRDEEFTDLPSRWEYITRRFPFVSGVGEWEEAVRSTKFRGRLKEDDSRAADLLEKSLEYIFPLLNDLPEQGLPSAHSAATLRVFDLLTEASKSSEMDFESIRNLGGLDEILGEISADEFHLWARTALEKAQVPTSRSPARFRILSIQQARGLSFGTVAIPGMVEGVFPARGTEDPLLPDSVRASLNDILSAEGKIAPLPLKSNRLAEERFLFWTVLQSSERCVILGYPRGGPGRGDDPTRPPSLFLEYIADASGLEKEDPEAMLRRFPGYRTASTALEPAVIKDRPLSLLEHDLGRLFDQIGQRSARGALSEFTGLKPGFGRRVTAWRELWEKHLTSFDGVLDEPGLIEYIRARLNPEKTQISVTALERFFTCPYQFALKHLLDLREEKEPMFSLEAEGDVRGRFYHSALQRFAERVKKMEKGFGALAPGERRSLVGEAVREAGKKFEIEDRHPLPIPWEVLKMTVERDLDLFFKKNYEREPGWTPLETEGWIGGKIAPRFGLTEDGRKIHLIGRFDLVERKGEEHRFVDYKSGWSTLSKKGALGLDGGVRLQADLYSHCAADRFGEGTRVCAAYAYPTERGEYRLTKIPPEMIEDRREDLSALLGFYVRALDRGHFFPTPFQAYSGRTCGNCEYISVCGPGRKGRADRKADNDLRAELDALRQRTK